MDLAFAGGDERRALDGRELGIVGSCRGPNGIVLKPVVGLVSGLSVSCLLARTGRQPILSVAVAGLWDMGSKGSKA